jgi:hypothetical protein
LRLGCTSYAFAQDHVRGRIFFSINILVTFASKIVGMLHRVDAWDVWYRDLGYIDGARHKTYACNFCNKGIAYRASRLHRYLGYEGGVNDVAYCTRVPL